MKFKLHRWAMTAFCAVLVGCGGGATTSPSSSAGGASMTPAAGGDTSGQRLEALGNARVPMPSGAPSVLDAGAVSSAVNAAKALPGSRGAFEDFHRNVAPLLPSPSLASTLGIPTSPPSGTVRALATAPQVDQVLTICINIDGDNNTVIVNDPALCPPVVPPPLNPPPNNNNCPVVCATACAEANAQAWAYAWAQAWAHASATACAWAQAWACVYNGIFPFNQVCAWAQGQACATAFASAFAEGWGEGYAWYAERKCEKRCSDGQVVQWFEKPAQPAGNN